MFRTLTTAVGATALTAALVLGGATAATASEPAPEPTASSECSFGAHLLHAWLRLPADLRGDLRAIRDLPREERQSALRDVREGALGGDYGTGVQEKAEALKVRRLDAWSTMPPELRADLVELRQTAPGERRALAEEIAQNALDGVYGDKAQATAERIRSSEIWQNCVAKLRRNAPTENTSRTARSRRFSLRTSCTMRLAMVVSSSVV